MAQSSQRKEPPRKPGRFTAPLANRRMNFIPASVTQYVKVIGKFFSNPSLPRTRKPRRYPFLD